MEKAGLVHKGDGKDVDHKTPLSKGGATTRSNLSVKAASSIDHLAETQTIQSNGINQKMEIVNNKAILITTRRPNLITECIPKSEIIDTRRRPT
jgi:hypothetical protein